MFDGSRKIVIMCGGKGSRMGEITYNLPKPLIEINGKPILEYKIKNYLGQNFDDITLALGYKKEKVKSLISSYDNNIKSKINFSYAGETVGILERIYCAVKKNNQPVLVTYGDTITNINLNKLFETHKNSNNEATIVITSIMNPFGLVEFNSDNKVTIFKEKPLLNYFIGYFVINSLYVRNLSKEIISLPDGDGIVKIFQDLIQKKKLGSYFYDGKKITFNTPSELEIAKEKIINFYTSKEEN